MRIFVSVKISKMEEEKKLVPFRLCTLLDEYSWGSEEWHLADLGWRDTAVRDGWLAGNLMDEIMETYLDRVTGDGVFEWYGRQFPFCVKTLQLSGRMPLTVCPGDELAAERYDSLGKEKFWYVLSASPETRIFMGLRKAVTAADFMEACASSKAPAGEPSALESLLNAAPVKAGAFYHIPPGVPHCLSGKATVLEIAESSALDFRLCDWGAGTRGGSAPESDDPDYGLGLVEALDFLNLDKFPPEALLGYNLDGRREGDPENVSRLVSLPQFSVNRIDLKDPVRITAGVGASCVAYSCISGMLSVKDPESGDAPLLAKAGETVLVPAECDDFTLAPLLEGTVLLETLVEPRVDTNDAWQSNS